MNKVNDQINDAQIENDLVENDLVNNEQTGNDLIDNDQLGLIVHSYNNYLSGVMGFTELAMMEAEQEDVKQRLTSAMASANESVTFGQELLSSISRLQVRFETYNLFLLLENLENQLQDGIVLNIQLDSQLSLSDTNSDSDSDVSQKKQKPISLLAKNTNQELVIKTNPKWLIYSLNQLANFIYDFFKLTTLEVSVSKNADCWTLTFAVKRSLSQQDANNIFRPFYSSRTLLGQKSVGLASLSGFLKQMDGQIQWQNERGFKLTIPNC